ncbi:unnamed protein product [Scytosiphon promiscuus]
MQRMVTSTVHALSFHSPRAIFFSGVVYRGRPCGRCPARSARFLHSAMARRADRTCLTATPTLRMHPEPGVHSTISDFRRARRNLPRDATVGFVPTMGALHEGHADLFRRARRECDVVVGSVFVNPAQFAPHEDLDRYPRQLQRDLDLLATEGLVDLLFAPTRGEMYPPEHRIYVDPVGFDELPEGAARPGFFRGVATVVTKLLNVVQPDLAFFGQKDALQCVLVKRLVEDLNMPVEVVVSETRREADGLAMSSRNAYMSEEERAAAPAVYLSLKAAAEARRRAVEDGRQASRQELVAAAEAVLSSEPLVSSVDYLSVGSSATMEELDEVGPAGAIISVAARLGSVRLIDNVVLPPLR